MKKRYSRLWASVSRVSANALIADLQRVARVHPECKVTRALYDFAGRHSSSTVYKCFGSWNKALTAADLEISNRRISDGEVLADMRRVAKENPKRKVTVSVYRLKGKYSPDTVATHFGSWNKGLIAAGLKLSHSRNISKKELLEDLLRVAKMNPQKKVTAPMYDQKGKYYASAFVRHFGYWSEGLTAAGLETSYTTPHSDKELLEDLLRVAEMNPQKKVTASMYKRQGKYSNQTVINHFGSWNEGLIAAGLEVSSSNVLSDEELLENVLTLWKHYRRRPQIMDLARPPSKWKSARYLRRFGSWTNTLRKTANWFSTLRAADIRNVDQEIVEDLRRAAEAKPPRAYARIPDQEILEDLRRVAEMNLQRKVSKRFYDQKGKYSSVTVESHFGSWNEGLIAASLAGFKQNTHPR